jgi:GTP-binding protein
MEIKTAEYMASYPDVRKTPDDGMPEYAFIGRSNVGKSSLINMLCAKKGLAKTSQKPGKTQMINYFSINKEWYLVDLPGYGYAKISKTKRREWERMIEGYLLQKRTLMCAFVLVDANVPPQSKDMEFINWCGEMQVPFVIIFTKADKSKGPKVEENIKAFNETLLEHWEELPQQFITSANKGQGREEILAFIDGLNGQLGL